MKVKHIFKKINKFYKEYMNYIELNYKIKNNQTELLLF